MDVNSDEYQHQDNFVDQSLVDQNTEGESRAGSSFTADAREPIPSTALSPPAQDSSAQTPMPVPEPKPESPYRPNYKPTLMLSGHSRSIASIKFSPDGKMLASCAADKLIKLWDADTGDIIHTFEGHTEGVSDIAWAGNGDFLASASDDKTVRLWSMESVCTPAHSATYV
ncbi:WD repeat-containing protein 5 -like protein [Trametes pubescens]|uniref:WD repeat-containing protein 5-like protein n=1 Tax=Trametes pubescens TaxID=154538 RepID=A0A1M2VW29_TRAPU|nr:WD repeat-containing protein 5 -like protein [Trametes pubescens]